MGFVLQISSPMPYDHLQDVTGRSFSSSNMPYTITRREDAPHLPLSRLFPLSPPPLPLIPPCGCRPSITHLPRALGGSLLTSCCRAGALRISDPGTRVDPPRRGSIPPETAVLTWVGWALMGECQVAARPLEVARGCTGVGLLSRPAGAAPAGRAAPHKPELKNGPL